MRTTRHHRHHEPLIVVQGAPRPADVWPAEVPAAERFEVAAPARAAGELGDPRAVLELLAAVEGDDAATYAARFSLQATAVRALTAHCRAAVLGAALRVQGPVTPASVLAEVHTGLRRPIDAVELLAS